MGEVAAIVMAAGKGTRMKSNLPKVLHKICGKPLIAHVLKSIGDAGISDITVVVGHGREQVTAELGSNIKYAYQAEQLGTGHAVLQVKDMVSHDKQFLVVSGDTPLLTPETLAHLVKKHMELGTAVTVLTAELNCPTGYGRVVRNDSGFIQAIIEEKDASPEVKQIREINTGTYCFAGEFLFNALEQLKPENAQKEYYLTDLVQQATGQGLPVAAVVCEDAGEIQGINSRAQLAEAGRQMNQKILTRLMADGVTIVDPSTTYVDTEVKVGKDSILLPFTFLQGQTIIGEECEIGPHSRLIDTRLGNRISVENSVLKKSVVGDNCIIGPFAYLRPGTVLNTGVKVGDFVEIKNTLIEEGSKVPHLSYVGDSHIGKKVNIGAGTITCNYDGKNKHKTEISDGAFIGSNTNLVAPVKVGEGAVVAAGSTLTKDVPANSLGVARSRQQNINGWAKRQK